MKKMLSGLLMLAMFLSLSLAGWSAPALAETPADRAGSYGSEELYMDGEDYTEAMKTQGFTVTLVLNEDGTARMESSNTDETLTFRWDEAYFIYDSGEKTPYEYQDGVIRMEEDGSIMVFRKLSGDAEVAGEPEEPASDDSLTFSNGVIEKIVAISMREVPGVLGMKGSWFNRFQSTFGVDDATKGVTVEVTPENSVKVNISVLIEYGAYAPQVFEDTKRVVVERILSMTGLSVAGVNLRIEDVLTAEEYERYRARREAEARARRGVDERQKETAQKGEE